MLQLDIVTLAPSVFLMQINGVLGVCVELLSEVYKLVLLESVKSVHTFCKLVHVIQVECLCIFVQWKFVWEKLKMSVTLFAYIECTIRKWYHSIELAESFLLKYGYWTSAKTTASVVNEY